MDGSFRNDVGVEAIAEVNWVDVVTARVISLLFYHYLLSGPP